MERPPSVEELVGCPKPVTGLDERYVVKHFLGMSQAEARRMVAKNGSYLTEDFTYMAPPGLRYYLPPVLDYLRAEESAGDGDFCHGLLSSLYCQVTLYHPPPDVLSVIKEMATFCDAHRDKFGLAAEEELFDKYVRTI